MNENPFQSPATESTDSAVVGVNSGTHEDLLAVAKYQKGILGCILIYLLLTILQLVLPELGVIVAVSVLILGLAGTVFVFLLAIKVYSPVVGILFAILTLVPCVGLLMLLLINGKATRILKQNGIRVGLMGANLSEVKSRQA